MGELLPRISSLGEACCGCGACEARCPCGCISMERDNCGFPRPILERTKCVGCAACEAVCPVLSPRPPDECKSVTWASAKNAALLGSSSSGGLFGLLARKTISQNGIVVGAAWDDGCQSVCHIIVEDESGRARIMRSKYVQSTVGHEVYEGVRAALQAGRLTLFSGTACQVAGMRAYLGKLVDTAPFLGVEVICHGVPSPLLWKRWLEHVEEKSGAKIDFVNFRDKTTGWESYSVRYDLRCEEGARRFILTPYEKDWFMRAFLANASLRGSCLKCPAKRSSGADITLGDFWGIAQAHPSAERSNGVSAVVANTGRGVEALEQISSLVVQGKSAFELVVVGNASLVRSAPPFDGRKKFLGMLAEDVPVSEMVRQWPFEKTILDKVGSCIRMAKKRLKQLGKRS